MNAISALLWIFCDSRILTSVKQYILWGRIWGLGRASHWWSSLKCSLCKSFPLYARDPSFDTEEEKRSKKQEEQMEWKSWLGSRICEPGAVERDIFEIMASN
ncbi:hypothetical protein AMTR_s00053p00191900 [Amborella trichopoda]|uniref:Uncharacterized protein n=1 Tax=Amborella trichopoda TaxID=13333 RepID=W1PDK6_AMBTC|nr:hypothetical protein AMTR_s00053p00191900 [Amborella trichopoda]